MRCVRLMEVIDPMSCLCVRRFTVRTISSHLLDLASAVIAHEVLGAVRGCDAHIDKCLNYDIAKKHSYQDKVISPLC